MTFLPSYTNILKRECLKIKEDLRFNTHAELHNGRVLQQTYSLFKILRSTAHVKLYEL